MNKSRDSPKEFGVLGREVLGEECSLIPHTEGGKVKKPLEVKKTNLSLKETKQWLPEADTHGNKRPRLWNNAQTLNHL